MATNRGSGCASLASKNGISGVVRGWSPAAGFFSKKNGSALDFSARRGYSNVTAQQWRDGRAAKATVCKTGSGGFNSHSRLQFAPSLRWQGFPLIFPAASFFVSYRLCSAALFRRTSNQYGCIAVRGHQGCELKNGARCRIRHPQRRAIR